MRQMKSAVRVWNVVGALAALLLAPVPALSQEPGRSGFYVGGHMGYLFGNGTATLADPIGVQSAGGTTPYGTFYGGVHAGYEQHFASRLMLGLELDMSFANYSDLANVLSYRATGTGTANEQLEYLSSLRGRAGYDVGSWTPFVTGGIAWASTRYSRTDLTTGNEDASPSNIRVGWTVGGGLDYRLDPRWTTRLEYLYTNLGLSGLLFGAAPARYNSQYRLHQFRVGLNYKFGVEDDKKAKADDRGPGSWEIHGQTTFIYQGYPPILRALQRPQQPAARGPEPRDLDGVGLPRRAALAGRRALFQSRAAAGLRRGQHRGGGRLSQRRGAEVELPLSALQRLAPVPAAGDRPGRRARDGRERIRPALGRARRQSRHAAVRQVLGEGHLRHQRLCQ